MRLTFAALAAIGLLAGCGGGGGVLGTSADASLSVSPNPAAFGTPVTVTWRTNKAVKIESSNFGVGRTDLNGSITDNPGITTTYELKAEVKNDDRPPISVSKSVTLTVPRSTKGIVIVGDSALAGTNQVLDSLSTITSGPISVSPAMPSTTTAQAVVLHTSANVSTADLPKFDALLSAGKSVIFINESVNKISGGNVASIGGKLAGSTGFVKDPTVGISFRTEAGMVPLSATLRGVSFSGNDSALRTISTSADRLIASSGALYTTAMAYKVPTGGRTGFVGDDGVGSDTTARNYNAALKLIVRWALDGS
jgi:hypothetical protein